MKANKIDRVVPYPASLMDDLENMSKKTRIPVTQLINLACYSLVANYYQKGSFIFADLIDPKHRSNNEEVKRDKLTPYPKDLLEELERISKESMFHVYQLTILACYSLVANFHSSNITIFADLLNPEHRQK